ncbi:uncharacterized protein LOC111338014 [Stylophora pistillata]|uniref:uncharacterized protein LOC111338014 n=1 Tax=Stylophora pistillata TaxID=50429 RepID=UPI000C04D5BF|nr:uncharacterized protein LOC111338014 [Stylophora pistillata]
MSLEFGHYYQASCLQGEQIERNKERESGTGPDTTPHNVEKREDMKRDNSAVLTQTVPDNSNKTQPTERNERDVCIASCAAVEEASCLQGEQIERNKERESGTGPDTTPHNVEKREDMKRDNRAVLTQTASKPSLNFHMSKMAYSIPLQPSHWKVIAIKKGNLN